MSMSLSYLVDTNISATVFLTSVATQIKVKGFYPLLYWTTIITTITVDTTLIDFTGRSLGIGYADGSTLLLALLFGSLFAWYRMLGSVPMSTVHSPRVEMFYRVTIMFSQTLDTALGDWTADTAGLGYTGAAMAFRALLTLIIAAYYQTRVSRTLLSWAALILTHPLSAIVGDFLSKPHSAGGLALGCYSVSVALLIFILTDISFFRQHAARAAYRLGAVAGGHMWVLLIELLGFVPARFSVDIGSKTDYRYDRTGTLRMAVSDLRKRQLMVPPKIWKRQSPAIGGASFEPDSVQPGH